MPRAYLKRPANPPVEALLFVCVTYEVPDVDVAYVNGPETFQCIEHLLEGDVVLVEAVGDEQPGDPARHVPGRPQQGNGVVLFLGGRYVPLPEADHGIH